MEKTSDLKLALLDKLDFA